MNSFSNINTIINNNFHPEFNSQSQDDNFTKNIFFDSIKSYDLNTFTKCLHNSNSDILKFTDIKNMNGKK